MSLPSTMKAVGYTQSGPIDGAGRLVDRETPVPSPRPRDLIVEVRAVSVNPVDTKVRKNRDPGGELAVLGWDAAGVVAATGDDAELFEVGDEVYYCGTNDRPGANSALHAVDERLVGHKPATLSFAEAAALPLTTLTAWEALFDHLELPHGKTAGRGETLLVTAAAGGVGSIALQLARLLTGATVIGTASRPESVAWATAMGAHHVLDHSADLLGQLHATAPGGVTAVVSPGHTARHFPVFVETIAPFGRIVSLDEVGDADVQALKPKSASLHWEYVFTRPAFAAADQIVHHEILEEVARLVDAGLLKTTMTAELGPIDAEHLSEAHRRLEDGSTIGKIVLAGF